MSAYGLETRIEKVIKEVLGKKNITEFINDVVVEFNLGYWEPDIEEDPFTPEFEFGDQLIYYTYQNRIKKAVFAVTLDGLGACGNIEYELEVLKDFIQEYGATDITCPLCNSGGMEYRSVHNPHAHNENKVSHMWVCPVCPNIMFEYYDNSDIQALLRGVE